MMNWAPTVILSTTLFALGEVATPTDGLGLIQTGLQQGGLLAVVLVLLYFQRQNEKEKAARSQESISTLIGIVEKASDSQVANALAIQRLATAVENLRK